MSEADTTEEETTVVPTVGMVDILMSVNDKSVDVKKLKEDDAEITTISNAFPADGIVHLADMERLAGLSMRGISICDYWAPILIVVIGDINSQRNAAKNKAYINAEEPKSGKLTADLRRCISEADPEYMRLCLIHERMKAILRHFDDKRDSFKTFHFFMKDQQKAYGYQGGRHINGDSLEFNKSHSSTKTTGEEDF